MLGWMSGLLGRRRKRGGLSLLVAGAGVLACVTSFLSSTLVVYLNWAESRQTAALPRPAPDELRALAPGTRVLVPVRLPDEALDGAPGLALFYVERPSNWDEQATAQPTPYHNSPEWEMAVPPPARLDVLLEDGTTLSVQIPPKTVFINQQIVDAETRPGETPRRYVGYLPGQALVVNGVWEGHGLLTAQALYAGSVQAYQAHLNSQPGQAFVAGLVCGGIGLGLLALGALLFVLGK